MTNETTARTVASAFDDYVGRSETVTGHIFAQSLDLMAAMLNRRFDDISPNGALPLLWHLLILQTPVLQSQIGPDGHPARGGLIPPITYPRRMFAGSRVRVVSPLYIGDEVERTTTIKSITPKTGRSGSLIFVTLEQAFRGPRGLAITDEQDLVFREVDGTPPSPVQPPSDRGIPSGFSAVEVVHPDPVLLFRYSAAAGVSHRIHYDLDYVRAVEGYPNLIVHGPLQAIMLADLAARRLRRPLTTFEFRIIKPLFVGAPVYCVAKEAGGKALLQTLDAAHSACMSAHAE